MSDNTPSPAGTRRPHGNLLVYYVLQSLLLGPFFFFLLIPRYLRYHTLRYEFDDEGVTMRWGALFRREISLTFGRIQDIHLTSNFVERRLGLARIRVQTASGAAAAEMTIEGLQDFEAIRNRLYERMHGTKHAPSRKSEPGAGAAPGEGSSDALVQALRETAAELRALREELARRRPETGPETGPVTGS